MRREYVLVAALLAGAVVAGVVEFWPRTAGVAPTAAIDLRGKFVGPKAAEDAAAFAGLCHGIAAALEADAGKTPPRITTGVQLEDLRVAAAEGRFLPRSLSREQPHAVAVTGRYLDDVAGTSGGPLDAAGRQRWVQAFRELAKAAEEAVR